MKGKKSVRKAETTYGFSSFDFPGGKNGQDGRIIRLSTEA